MNLVWTLAGLGIVALFAVMGALLILLHRIDQEFSMNHGSTLRDATDRLERAVDRIEGGAIWDRTQALHVADNLTVAQGMVDAVASDLSDAHDRADVAKGPDGAAADAASRRPEK